MKPIKIGEWIEIGEYEKEIGFEVNEIYLGRTDKGKTVILEYKVMPEIYEKFSIFYKKYSIVVDDIWETDPKEVMYVAEIKFN